MAKLLSYLIIFIFFFTNSFGQSTSTCKELAERGIAILNENSYIPDGRYNSTLLKENEVSQVYKPFIKGKKYMIVITADKVLPGFEVSLADMTRKIIYNDSTSDNKIIFEYTPEKSQNLIISVKVNESEEVEKNLRGCVNIIIGSIRIID